MDTLALVIIAVGVVAGIGVVLVAMNGSDSGSPAAEPAKEAAKPKAAPARPRPRKRQQAVAQYAVPAPQHNGFMTGGTGPQAPLVAGFVQVVSSELQSLRQQQDRIDQRLKLINGIGS